MDMKLKSIVAGCLLCTCACAAQAQTAGSLLLSAGWLHFITRDSSGPLTLTGPVVGEKPHTGASVSNADSVGVSATYFVTDNVASELVLGLPPKFDLKGAGELSPLGKIGSVRQLSPTLLLKYYFFDASTRLRPYLGVGVSRVWFKNVRITNPALETVLHGPTTASAKNAWSPIFNAGVSYQWSEHWFGGLSVSYMPLRTTAKLKTKVNEQVTQNSEASLKVNPVITYLNVGYRF